MIISIKLHISRSSLNNAVQNFVEITQIYCDCACFQFTAYASIIAVELFYLAFVFKRISLLINYGLGKQFSLSKCSQFVLLTNALNNILRQV